MSLSYNPNIDVSYHQQYDQSPSAINFPRDGNFKPIDSFNSSYQMQPQMMQQPQQQMMQQVMPMPMQQPIMPQMYNPHVAIPKQNKKIREKFIEPPVEKSNKINWRIIVKKIVIYTMLFLIMSHVKMNELIFKILPVLEMHEIGLMILKGFLMSLVVIIIQIFL
jgi:hypothetical protein